MITVDEIIAYIEAKGADIDVVYDDLITLRNQLRAASPPQWRYPSYKDLPPIGKKVFCEWSPGTYDSTRFDGTEWEMESGDGDPRIPPYRWFDPDCIAPGDAP